MKTEQVFKGVTNKAGVGSPLQLKSIPSSSSVVKGQMDVLAKIKGQNAIKELKDQLVTAENKAQQLASENKGL